MMSETLNEFRRRMKNICNEHDKLLEEHTEHRINFYKYSFEEGKLIKIGEWLLKPIQSHVFGK